MNIIKRSGKEELFDKNKIHNAISNANNSVEENERIPEDEINTITNEVTKKCENLGRAPEVEEIQDLVEKELIKHDKYFVAKSYIIYRYERSLVRNKNTIDDDIMLLLDRNNEKINQENSNKNPVINSTQRDYMAGELSRDLSKRYFIPKDVEEAHEKGIIHFHDSDYFAQKMTNCCLINIHDMLWNGTVISEVQIDRPHSFRAACNIATQIDAQVASNQYGGQTLSVAQLAPFVDISRKKIRERHKEEYPNATEEEIESAVNRDLLKEISDGVQTIQYQLVTLMTTNGQTPFVSLMLYINEYEDPQLQHDTALIIEEILKQRIRGLKNSKGVWITPAFPKLLYVLDENNTYEGSEYFYLTKLAAKCTAKRMVPDYISAKIMREYKGDVYPCMGCRSFLTPDRMRKNGIGNIANAKDYDPEKNKYYGRFNQGVITINLPYIACMSNGDEDKFWKLMNKYLELCHKGLRARHDRLLGTPSDVAPILWQYGAYSRLEKGEKIDKLLYHGYSTISLGYAGLAECVYRMKGCSHTSENGKEFGLKVMQMLNDKCTEWKQAEDIDYSVYGTPIESTTYKFAKALQRDFGIIPHVSDKNYVTNSYHIHVTEPIDAFKKLKLESEFQKLSPGGAISYVEIPNMQNNIQAVIKIIQYIYETIMYAELNTKSDYCQVCGYDGEIKIVEDENKKLIWKCPNCGNTDQSKMNVARRTCGLTYIGSR